MFAKNKDKVVRGVHYEMSQTDFDLMSDHLKQLQQILSRVHVVKSKKAPLQAMATTALVTAEKEQLNISSLKRLFGANYKKVCVYNNENRTLLTKKYNGVEVDWDNNDTKNSEKLKELIDKEFPDFELVAQVTMLVSESDWPGWCEWTHANKHVKFDKNGKCIVGNMIIRNKKIGKLELWNSEAWIGMPYRDVDMELAAGRGASWFAHDAMFRLDFWQELFAGRIR